MGKKDKKAYEAYLKAHKGKGSSGNSFLSTNTNKSKKEVKKRVKAVRKSTPKKSGSQEKGSERFYTFYFLTA